MNTDSTNDFFDRFNDAPTVLTVDSMGLSADAAADDAALRRATGVLDQLETLSDLLSVDRAYVMPPLEYEIPAGFLLSVVIPVYNEEKTIHEILARVGAIPLPKEVVVVDDCSTDATRELLQPLESLPEMRIVYKRKNEGKGAALRTGFREARGDVVVVQDADLEYDPRDIPGLLKPLLDGDADVVYGSRFLGGRPQDPSLVHRLGNGLLTKSSNLFTGLRLTDMETCYKAFRREVIQSLEIKQNRFGFEPEVTAKLARRKHRIVEMPITYNARGYDEGKKIGVKDLFNAFYCIVRYGLAN